MSQPAQDLEDHGFSPEFVAKVVVMILEFQRNAAARAAARASEPDDLDDDQAEAA